MELRRHPDWQQGGGGGAREVYEKPRQTDGTGGQMEEMKGKCRGGDGEAGKLRVLLVEDHAELASALAFLLRQDGCLVYVAGSVKAALEVAQKEAVDLVVSDLGLPDGDGRELMVQLRERYQLRGIALTGSEVAGEGAELRGRGFVDALKKPVDFEDLFAAVHGAARAVGWGQG